MIPRGLRNNNPGNIEKGEKWQGLAKNQTDNRFCTFESMEYGCRALIKLILTYMTKRNCMSVSDIINRYAPSNENNTNAYINSVCLRMGVKPNESLPIIRDVVVNLAKAIAYHENGAIADSYISDATWNKGADLAGV